VQPSSDVRSVTRHWLVASSANPTPNRAPEDWAELEAFYTALELVGTPSAEVVESVL